MAGTPGRRLPLHDAGRVLRRFDRRYVELDGALGAARVRQSTGAGRDGLHARVPDRAPRGCQHAHRACHHGRERVVRVATRLQLRHLWWFQHGQPRGARVAARQRRRGLRTRDGRSCSGAALRDGAQASRRWPWSAR